MPIGASSNAWRNTSCASLSAASCALRSVMSRRFATQPLDARVVRQVGDDHVEPAPRAVAVAEPRLRRCRALGVLAPPTIALRSDVDVVGVRELEARHAERLRRASSRGCVSNAGLTYRMFASEPITMMMSRRVLHERAEALLAAARSSALDALRSRSSRAFELLDRERDAERGEHREAVHERLARRASARCRARSRARRASAPRRSSTIAGATAREPDRRMLVDRAEHQADREHRAPADRVHHGGDADTSSPRRAPTAANPDGRSPHERGRDAGERGTTRRAGCRPATSAWATMRSSRRATQNTGTTIGSVRSVGSTQRDQKRLPKLGAEPALSTSRLSTGGDGCLIGSADRCIGAGAASGPVGGGHDQRPGRLGVERAGRGGSPARGRSRTPASASAWACALDALGDRRRARACARSARSPARASEPGPREDVVHERAVDLEHVDRELLEVRERRVAGAEVVDREPDAEVAQPAQARPSAAAGSFISAPSVISRISRSRLEAAPVEQRLDPVGEVGVEQLARRDVHADRRRASRADARRSSRALPRTRSRSTCWPISSMRPASSANGMNDSGPSRPRSGCCQRTSASSAVMRPDSQLVDRLVVHDELAAFGRAAEVRLEVEPFDRGEVHLVREHAAAVLAAGLRRVHREVGVAQHLVGAGAGRSVRDADARGRRDLHRVEHDRVPAARR